MRRRGQNFELLIDGPSVGLVTLLPTDQPDARAASVASNVRFRDAQVENAPGYGVLTTVPELDSRPTVLFQGNTIPDNGTRPRNIIIIGTTQKLYALTRLPTPSDSS